MRGQRQISPGAGVMSYLMWELGTIDPLGKQQAILTTEPFLQFQYVIFLRWESLC